MAGGLCACRGSVERVSNGCEVLTLRGVRHGCSRICGPGPWLGNVVEKRGQWALAGVTRGRAVRSVVRSRAPEETGHVPCLAGGPRCLRLGVEVEDESLYTQRIRIRARSSAG